MQCFKSPLAHTLLCAVSAVAHPQSHPFDVADDIEMVRLSDPRPGDGSEAAKTSSDGKHVAVVTTRGIVKSNLTESTLSVFDVASLRAFLRSSATAAPKPRIIARLSAVQSRTFSFAYAPVITDLQWSPDSRHLYFVGEDSAGDYRLYRVRVDGAESVPLSPRGWNVTQFTVGVNAIAFTAWRSSAGKYGLDDSLGERINADAHAVTGMSIRDILFYDPSRDKTAQSTEVFVISGIKGKNSARPVIHLAARDYQYLVNSRVEPISLSPSGHKLIKVSPISTVPKSWEAYEPARGFEHVRLRPDDPSTVSPDNLQRPKQYDLIDLDNGKLTQLVRTPYAGALAYGDRMQIVWAHDENRVLLTNTFLPLDNLSGSDRAKRLKPCAVASVDIATLATGCVMFNPDGASGGAREDHSVKVSFGKTDNQVIVHVSSKGHEETKEFIFDDGQWTLRGREGETASDAQDTNGKPGGRLTLSVIVKQNLNDPPALWVTDDADGKSKKLWDPNPQLRNMQLGEASIYRWKDETGHQWKGGLVKPIGYVPGRRYPVVLQIYDLTDQWFLTDGMMPTAFAARHLASAGIMSLQIQKDEHTWNDEEEQHHLRALTSAINQLSRDGLVDPHEVGIVGFSISCQYIENALIKAPGLFAAATIADGTDHSYMQYHLWDDTNLALRDQDERIIGSKAVGDGLRRWLEMAPGFHLDSVRAPLRIEAIGPWSLLGEWEIYSSLRLQGKPVDLIYFPNGQHIHQTPLERMASQQGDVEWFRFWLQGYEDPDPTKRAQYHRWEALRAGIEP